MKEIFIFFGYMIVIILIGGFHMYGKINDFMASSLFIGIFLVPVLIKLLTLPKKKKE